MSDETFERFKAQLGDYVTQAINQRYPAHVGHTAPCHCPMGCHPRLQDFDRRPSGPVAAQAFGIRSIQAMAFACGFDGKNSHEWRRGAFWPYYQLGHLYRERFSP